MMHGCGKFKVVINVSELKYWHWQLTNENILENLLETNIWSESLNSFISWQAIACVQQSNMSPSKLSLRILTDRYLRPIVFCIGLSLTVWRSFECLQKYQHQNLSTRVTMVQSFETLSPAIVICPSAEFNLR